MINFSKEQLVSLEAAIDAGKEIMKIYESEDFSIETKEDNSPLTQADKKSNEIINSFLSKTDFPIISEENKLTPYSERKNWKKYWLVDPIDGTKEFIKKNGEFTVNIALIENQKPVFGVVYAPALKLFYFGGEELEVSYVLSEIEPNINRLETSSLPLEPNGKEDVIRVLRSRSHMNEKTKTYIADLSEKHIDKKMEIVAKGSSLKFCLLASGDADIYPRFGLTMEWDTAAGHAICLGVGCTVNRMEKVEPLTYNKESLLNPDFLASNMNRKLK